MSKDFIKIILSQIQEDEENQKDSNRKFWDMIDRRKETVVSYIERKGIKEPWAIEFLKKMEIGL